MKNQGSGVWSRREFLTKMTLAGTAGFLGVDPSSFAGEPPPETTRIRLSQVDGICVAPQYVVKELLPGEGFRDIQYVRTSPEISAKRTRVLARSSLAIF
jgi:NitT/TauT family transport system substrate-binding protein